MTSLSPQFVATFAGVSLEDALSNATGVSFHSARVRPGDAFFALPGAAGHGLEYAEQALAAGAAFIVSDRPHPRGIQVENPARVLTDLGKHARGQLRGPVVGVTGSAGKTSTKAMLSTALHAEASPGNFNTPLALAQVLVDAWLQGKTTRDERLVLELGIDHIGEMDELIALAKPTHAVLTLIAESHLKDLGDVETVAREKLKLVDAAEYAFVSEQAAPFLNDEQRKKSTVYGLGADADLSGVVTDISPRGQRLQVAGVTLTLPYLGDAMARNAVATLGLAQHFGFDLNEAAKGLERVRLEPGRLQVHRRGDLTVIDDSYNSNPASAAVALEVLRHFPKPHSAVLGDMLELGVASETLHRDLGKRTLEIDYVVAVGDETRFIAAENSKAVHLSSNDLLNVTQHLPTQGTVLIKGSRGMRLERLVQALLETNEDKEGTQQEVIKS